MASEVCPSCGVALAPDSPGGVCPNCLLDNALNSNPAAFDRAPFAATSPGPGRVAPPAVGEISDLFPQLDLECLIGHGGMGAVYKAKQKKLEREVALKLIRGESATDPAFAERFMREARTLARLNHPNIVAVHDFGEVTRTTESSSETMYFFVMEFVDGANLRQLMQDGGLDSGLALSVVSQVCEALQYAHDEGIVHRDIKPENILIDARGRVKIADFGLAKLAEASADHFTLTGTHQVMGTPRYMAPEQMAGSRTVDHRADIYSLGVVFYEMLTGQIPAGHFEPPSSHKPVDVRLDDVVLRALARDPGQRFQSVSELRSDVDQISGDVSARSNVSLSPGPESAQGFSTILDREAAAAWNLFGVGADDRQGQNRPQLPSLLLLAVCICGCISVFLPWAEVAVNGPPGFASHAARPDATSYLFCQEAAASAAPSVSASRSRSFTVKPGESLVFIGVDYYPGFVSAILFGVMIALLIVIPRRIQSNLSVVAIIAGASFAVLIQLLIFRTVVASTKVNLVVDSHSSASIAGNGPDSYQFCTLQESSFEQTKYWEPISNISHQFNYRSGFFTALGACIVLVVVSGLGIRQSVAHLIADRPKRLKEKKLKNSSVNSGGTTPGRSIAAVRFQTVRPDDLDGLLKFHFEGVGYQLVEQGTNEWVFRRGQRWGALWATDIRTIETTLTVRIAAVREDSILVNCEWKLVTLGAVVTKAEKRRLESEARELQQLLDPHRDMNDSVALGEAKPGATGAAISSAVSAAMSAVGALTSTDEPQPSEPSDVGRNRFSRRAILGACIAPVGITSLAIFGILYVFSFQPGESISVAPLMPGIVLLMVSLISGAATTILGFVSLSEIRNSDGRIRGMGLAFCDAALFPAVFTILAVTTFVGAVVCNVIPNWQSVWFAILMMFVALATTGFVLFTVKSLWRQVAQSATVSGSSVSGPAGMRPGNPTPYETLWQSGDVGVRRSLMKLRTASFMARFSAVLGFLHAIGYCLVVMLTSPYPSHEYLTPAYAMVVLGVLSLVLVTAVIAYRAAVSMRAVRHYEFCFAGSILLLLPWSGFAWVVAFPTGVWLFHLLQREEIRELFLRGETSGDAAAAASA